MPHVFLMACLLGRQFHDEKAWESMAYLEDRIETLDIRKLSHLSQSDWERAFTKPGSPLHGFPPRDGSERSWRLSTGSCGNTEGTLPAYGTTSPPAFATVIKRFLEFEGIGQKISTMATNILARYFKIPMSDCFSVEVTVDGRMKRVLSRMGIVDSKNPRIYPIDPSGEMYPKYPGIFDPIFWEIGKFHCFPVQPDCAGCPANGIVAFQPAGYKKGRTGLNRLKRPWSHLPQRLQVTIPFFLGGLALLSSGGCGTVPLHAVPVLPAPVTSFPPAKPGLVRLPVDITFPSGGDLLTHLSNLFKGGFQQLVPDPGGMPGLHMKAHVADLWATMQTPIFLDKGLWLLIRPETLSVGMMRTDLKRATTVHTVLEMTAQPEIIFGAEPPTTPVALPPLRPFRPGPGMFEVMSNTRVTYKEANQYFQDPRLKLIGMVFPGTGAQKHDPPRDKVLRVGRPGDRRGKTEL